MQRNVLPREQSLPGKKTVFLKHWKFTPANQEEESQCSWEISKEPREKGDGLSPFSQAMRDTGIHLHYRHNRMERNHCRINEPEILNQVRGSIRFLNFYYRYVKRERGRIEECVCLFFVLFCFLLEGPR